MTDDPIVAALLIGAWFGVGALGVRLANGRLNQRWPNSINRTEDAWMYVLSLGGVSTFIGCMIYLFICPPRRA